jgi:hypothetical protein
MLKRLNGRVGAERQSVLGTAGADVTGGLATLEAWLEPWLSGQPFGGARMVLDVPAKVVLEGLACGQLCDDGVFDGLPGAGRMAGFAVQIHPEAVLRGCLIDFDRDDARLHLDTIDIPGGMDKWPLLRSVVRVIPRDERPDVVEPTSDPQYWRLWWD